MKAYTVVMSHLADIQEELSMGVECNINLHNNFARYIIFELQGNLMQDIDPDKMYLEFKEKSGF